MSVPRSELVPNANSHRMLARVVDLVAGGARDSRAIAAALGCRERTARYYTQAGEWLGLLESHDFKVRLTRLGLEYAYADRDRPRVYADAVWRTSFVLRLMAGRGDRLPDTEEIASFIQREAPDLAAATARRRASAVRSLVEPAMRFKRAPVLVSAQQSFDFKPRWNPGGTVTPITDLAGGTEVSPEVYLVLLRALLEHGELSSGQVRALLDAAGADNMPVGSTIEMSLRRGDARRVDDRLVVTPGALERAGHTSGTAGVALSDPGYRAYLSILLDGPATRHDEVRLGAARSRYRSWDRRVFGREAEPARLRLDLDRVLLGRDLAGFPVAGSPGPEPPVLAGTFLELASRPGLVVARPRALRLLAGGTRAVNDALTAVLRSSSGVRLPGILERRVLVHGGLVAPGETVPRQVPDGVSLRLRVIERVPHLALLAALLLLHRQGDRASGLFRDAGRWNVEWRGGSLGSAGHCLDAFAAHRGWMVTSASGQGTGGGLLAEVLEGIGVAVRVGRRLVLDEGFFVRLYDDPEHLELKTALEELADSLASFIETSFVETGPAATAVDNPGADPVHGAGFPRSPARTPQAR